MNIACKKKNKCFLVKNQVRHNYLLKSSLLVKVDSSRVGCEDMQEQRFALHEITSGQMGDKIF
jgi:hypothetical protein